TSSDRSVEESREQRGSGTSVHFIWRQHRRKPGRNDHWPAVRSRVRKFPTDRAQWIADGCSRDFRTTGLSNTIFLWRLFELATNWRVLSRTRLRGSLWR